METAAAMLTQILVQVNVGLRERLEVAKDADQREILLKLYKQVLDGIRDSPK